MWFNFHKKTCIIPSQIKGRKHRETTKTNVLEFRLDNIRKSSKYYYQFFQTYLLGFVKCKKYYYNN